MKKITYFSLFLIIILFSIFWFIGESEYKEKYANLEFINNSGEPLDIVSITLNSKTCSVNRLLASDSLKCIFKNIYDDSYHIEIKYKNGKHLKDNLGYVTRGISFDDILILTSEGHLKLKIRENKEK
ncbi:MAG: hypothetical protein OEZ22_14345 [Spirochaetia bacterium]|nr:hypothetical protein [Spirochaetia bacterium]